MTTQDYIDKIMSADNRRLVMDFLEAATTSDAKIVADIYNLVTRLAIDFVKEAVITDIKVVADIYRLREDRNDLQVDFLKNALTWIEETILYRAVDGEDFLKKKKVKID